MEIGKLIYRLAEAIDDNTHEDFEEDHFSHQDDAYNAGVLDAWEAVRNYLEGLK